MNFYKPSGLLRPGGILFFVFFAGIISSITAEPEINVNSSFSQEKFTITLSGKQISEIQGLEFTCEYDTAYVAILESVLSSPLPGTALSVIVDEEMFTLSVVIQAVAAINVADGDPVFITSFYSKKQGQISAYDCLNFTKAYIIDKNGNRVEAVIDTGNTEVKIDLHLAQIKTGKNRSDFRFFQLNGRRLTKRNLPQRCNLYIRKDNGGFEKKLMMIKR